MHPLLLLSSAEALFPKEPRLSRSREAHRLCAPASRRVCLSRSALKKKMRMRYFDHDRKRRSCQVGRGLHRCSIHWVADNTLTRRVGNVKKASEVVDGVKIPVRSDLSRYISMGQELG